MFTKLSCKEVSALVVAQEDRNLKLSERLELRVHMMYCKACPDFERQMLTMRNAMRQWRNYEADPSATPIATNSDAPPVAPEKTGQ